MRGAKRNRQIKKKDEAKGTWNRLQYDRVWQNHVDGVSKQNYNNLDEKSRLVFKRPATELVGEEKATGDKRQIVGGKN